MHSYGDDQIMFDAFFTESLLKTGQLGFYRGGGDSAEINSNMEYSYTKMREWRTEYELKNNSPNPIKMNIDFIKEKAGIILISKIFNPIYFISFGDTTGKTIFYFITNFTILLISLLNFFKIKRKYPQQLKLILFILAGYYSVYFFTTAIARYLIPVLFYLAVFSGMTLLSLLEKRLKAIG